MRLVDRYAPITVKDSDDIGSNPSESLCIGEIIHSRLSRRDLLRGAAAGTALGVLGTIVSPPKALAAENPSSLTFEEIEHGIDEMHHVAKGYSANVLIRWGDKLSPDAPEFDPRNLHAASQERQFGYNCDFIAYMPLPAGSTSSDNGLLCVNHEYTNAEIMFPGLTEENKLDSITKDQVEVEIAAHGLSVVEVRKNGNAWQVVTDSKLNRRLPLSSTKMRISGPAAGHERLRTSADPTGTEVIGTANNCAGGTTPWGTVLTGEENTHGYFGGDAEAQPQAAAYKRYGISKTSWYSWWKYQDRFNVEKEPNEPNRFSWIVEYDPHDPASTPIKRTALGRFKHEGATTVINRDGRVVLYSGDDERFEYIYRFVTKDAYDPNDRAANLNLLDEGTLSVAKFNDDGTMEWLPLVHGQGPLTAENAFNSQADVVIEARRAADLLGATPMDRPEDVEPNPVTGRVYVVLTNNNKRGLDKVDAVNPRAENTTGHIIELVPPGGEGKDADHAADEFAWEFFLIAGDPTWGATKYGQGVSANGWLACPDNVAFDPKGRVWITTDQGSSQKKFKIGDGLYGADVVGDGRAITRNFFRVPVDAEMCGPAFTPDGKTLFVSVQHPGEGSSFDAPSTRWPDFKDTVPPRPSIVAITKDDGGEIGT